VFVADLYVALFGEPARPNTMVLAHRGWRIGGQVLTRDMLAG